MSMPKIAIIGECMIELSEKNHNLSRNFGGDTLNTAVYLKRQTSSALDVCYVTGLGMDSFSHEMMMAWQKEAINTTWVQRLENKLPGLYFIETDETGERTFYYWRNDAAARFWLQCDNAAQICDQLAQFDYLYLSGISIAILDEASRNKLIDCLKRCRANGGKVIFDNNYRPRLWANIEETRQAYQQVLSCTDIAFLTLDDEDMLWGKMSVEQVIERTQGLGVSEIVIKRGSDSCIVWCAEHQDDVPAIKLPKESVVDTTAAGDSFSAGYLAARLTGSNTVDSAKQGHLVASTVIQYRGAIIPMEAMPK